MSAAAPRKSERTAARLPVVTDVVCTRCGCLCDDIDVTVDPQAGRVIGTRNACELGRTWFLEQRPVDRPPALIHGQPATIEEAVHRAVEILSAADNPLTFGLGNATCEAQRVAVAITDRLGGTIDVTADASRRASLLALQTIGEVTCTLGELRHRADLLLIWGADPVVTHPRHFSRYSLTSRGEFTPRGRADRYAVLIGTQSNETANEVDQFIPIKPGSDFDVARVLRALARGVEPDCALEAITGVPPSVLRDLATRMTSCRYGAILLGEPADDPQGPWQCVEEIYSLVRDLNRHTRFVVSPLGGGGNAAGAENVLAWTTGYAGGVNFNRGYPRYNPAEFAADRLLEREEIDAALVVDSSTLEALSPRARSHLDRIPAIVLTSASQSPAASAAVAFTTSTFGLQTRGTLFRMDGVALPLRPVLDSPYPSQEEMLTAIESGLRSAGFTCP